VGPPASFNVSTTTSYAFRSRVLEVGPLHSSISLPDIVPRIYFSQKPMSLISLAVSPIPSDLDVLFLPVVLPLDVWVAMNLEYFACLKSCLSLRSLILGFLRCVVVLSSPLVHVLLGLGHFYSHSLGDVASLFFCRLVEYC
jgi:hypothetical protein